jgi:hypothetical protein
MGRARILPSPQLQFHDRIKVVWQGKTEPTVDDLKPFKEDSAERGTSVGDMDGFTENDPHHSPSEMADGTIASGTVYSDVEGQRQNPELKMVLALMDLITESDERQSNA